MKREPFPLQWPLGEITAKPFGVTSRRGSWSDSFITEDHLDTPFRDGAHAFHDAQHLKLPLFITTEDGDVDRVEFTGPGSGPDDRRFVRVARKERP